LLLKRNLLIPVGFDKIKNIKGEIRNTGFSRQWQWALAVGSGQWAVAVGSLLFSAGNTKYLLNVISTIGRNHI